MKALLIRNDFGEDILEDVLVDCAGIRILIGDEYFEIRQLTNDGINVRGIDQFIIRPNVSNSIDINTERFFAK